MAWWKLDEGNGTTVYDSSWHNLQGTIHGATWTSADGKYILSFNGESDYVSLPSLNLTNLDALTVSAWINCNLTKAGFIMYNGNLGEFKLGNGDTSVDPPISGRYTNYANFSVKLSDNGWYTVSYSFPMQPNTWHHLVGIWTKGDALKIYVDDILARENDNLPQSSLFVADATFPGSFPSSLGICSQAQWGNSSLFRGQLSNVMIYNKALNSQEVENLTSQIAQSLSIPKPSSIMQQFSMANVIYIFVAVSLALLLSIAVFVYGKKRKRL
jgi:arabinan endo-1,5-alpha-L-arabinosidase